MLHLTWKRRVPTDASVGYWADGADYRYVVYRYESSWLLQIRRQHESKHGSMFPVDTDRNDTLALCKAVAQAYENNPAGVGNRLTRAIKAVYELTT